MDAQVQTVLDTGTIADAVREATQAVFSMMLSLEAEVQPHRTVAQPDPVDGVVALIGFTGPWGGTGALYCEEELACKMSSSMLMAEINEINGEVLDGVGEVANMVLGNFKESIETHTGALGLSIPTVVYGKNFSTRSAIKSDWTLVPFQCGSDTFEVRICMQPL